MIEETHQRTVGHERHDAFGFVIGGFEPPIQHGPIGLLPCIAIRQGQWVCCETCVLSAHKSVNALVELVMTLPPSREPESSIRAGFERG